MSELKVGANSFEMPAAKIPKIKTESHEKLQKAANEFEGMFMEIVMKSMRDTVGESDVFGDSKKVQFFQSMLDSEYSKAIGSNGKIGLSAAIMRQLSPKIPEAKSTQLTEETKTN